ncbi:hypothetical protein IRY55_05570 [Savagea sp. SN6]|uniref:Uncharacterized protein n=1 Tax=Savagea serpentis TaxID=2785297 RepID=A0A8J7KSR1_9BACL|nr:hypothetical protein [Savagea serpentis]MBF4500829.1 hypothetical protein [Savagea serpentis]
MIPNINLLPPKQESEVSSKLYVVFGGILILALVVLGFLYVQEGKKVKALQEESTILSTEMNRLTEDIDQLDRSELQTLMESVRFVRSISYPTSTIIDEVNRLKTKTMHVLNYQLTDTQLQLLMTFETMEEAARYLTYLQESPFVYESTIDSLQTMETVLDEENEEETEGELVHYDVKDRVQATFLIELDEDYLKEQVGDPIAK